MEGLSSLLVVQKLGQEGKRLVGRGEVYQFGLLITTAVAYVASAWWIVNVRGCFNLCSSVLCPILFYSSHIRQRHPHRCRRHCLGLQ